MDCLFLEMSMITNIKAKLVHCNCLQDEDVGQEFMDISEHWRLMNILDQNLTTGQCDGYPGPRAASTWPVQALMALSQCGTTRVDSLSVGQALRDMKMRFICLCWLTLNRFWSSLRYHTPLETTCYFLHFHSAHGTITMPQFVDPFSNFN